jgi:glycosyltransferase involved in cell wall biosynthesis
MLSKHAYYKVKPLIPGFLRLALRRWRAKPIFNSCRAIWPIYEPSGRQPEGWPGWPDGKQFSLVLTHDVESQRGLDRCRQLAEIEMEFGFRSSFNFIPQDAYEVPQELLSWLRQNGFEVGVHDYRHDGKLFRSRKIFRENAVGINRQLKEWGAVGFRAGFMLHQLDWLHDLDIEYDASTFDVDPFEPQPDGAQTVFPFWVPKPDPNADALRSGSAVSTECGDTSPLSKRSRETALPDNPLPSRSGYIELPYTLMQDYNLFVVLQQKGIDFWKQKLRWLAGKGAMAMLDTHPDYMGMPGKSCGRFEYPVQYYRDFLQHVRAEYAGQFWAALPREVAAYCRSFKPKQARPPRQIAMLAYSYFTSDNRIRRYAETLVRRGDEVKVFCLGPEEHVRSGQWQTLNGVQFLRLQSRANRESGKWLPAWRLTSFFFKALAQLGPRQFPHGCDLLHVHNIPDFLVFAGFRLKLRGTKIILDIHDIVPELYESKFVKGGGSSLFANGLRHIEKWSCRFADHVIIANHIWKNTLTVRAVPVSRLTALVNNVDLDLFSKRIRTRADDRVILIYPGTLNHHQGLDIAVTAMADLSPDFPNIEFHIYGRGPSVPDLLKLSRDLDLGEKVRIFDSVPLDRIPDLMANADIGIVPKRADGFGDQAYSTKIMEFMSQGLPVVLSRTRIDSLYFNDSVAAFFESGNPEDLARAIRAVLIDPEYRTRLSIQGYAYAQANSWETMKGVYLDIVDRLTTTGIPPAGKKAKP